MRLLLLLVGLTSAVMAAPPKDDPWETVAKFKAEELEEISGLAPSGKRPDIFWSHNDSGGDAALHALDLNGSFLGSVEIQDVKNKDWEDLAAFTYRGNPYLLIADTGDNKHRRNTVTLHAVPEPKPNQDGTFTNTSVRASWTLTCRYEDGPQDCEAIAVDQQGQRVLLLNKDGKASAVYTIPLFPQPKTPTLIAKKIATLPQTANATNNIVSFLKAGVLGARVTGMDFSPQGTKAVVLTYTDIRLFQRKPKEPWEQAFLKEPTTIALPTIYQPEAVCFGNDGQWIYVSSEETPTPLVRYPAPK
jgi:hypothetical protein